MDSATIERLGYAILGFVGTAIGGFYGMKAMLAVHAEKLRSIEARVGAMEANNTAIVKIEGRLSRLEDDVGHDSNSGLRGRVHKLEGSQVTPEMLQRYKRHPQP